MKKKLIFVCSPYRPVSENPKEAEKELAYNKFLAESVCKSIVQDGDIPFAPHLFFPQFLDDCCEIQRMEGIMAGLEMLELADSVIVAGERVSPGMAMEIKRARELKKPIFKLQGDGNDLYGELKEEFEELWAGGDSEAFSLEDMVNIIWQETQVPRKIVETVIRKTAEVMNDMDVDVLIDGKDENNE